MGFQYEAILKIGRCIQKGGRVRFDVMVKARRVAHVLHHIKTTFRHFYARVHRPFHKRHRSRAAAHSEEPVADVSSMTIKIASMNVNGVVGKKHSLDAAALRDKIDILGVQEHQRGEDSWQLRLPGFVAYTSPAKPAAQEVGARGISLFVRRHIPAFLRLAHDHFVIVELLLAGVKVVVASVYLPTRSKRKQMDVLKDLWNAVVDDVLNGVHVLLMGDFNNNRSDIRKRVDRIGMGFGLLDMNGPPETLHKKRVTPRAIDHFLCSPGFSSFFSETTVMRHWNFSDHFAIFTKLKVEGLVHGVIPIARNPRIKPELLGKWRDKIRKDNRFGPLIDMMPDELDPCEDPSEKVEEIIEKFIEISKDSIASMVGENPTQHRKRRRHANKRVLKAIEARSEEFNKVMEAAEEVREDPSAAARARLRQAEIKLDDATKEANKEVRRWRTAMFDRHVAKAVDMYGAYDFKRLFAWCRTLTGRSSRPSLQTWAVRDKDGNLILQPNQILKAWWSHYNEQASDVTGHSGDEEYWQNNLPHPNGAHPNMDELNAQVTWRELQETIMSMSRNKAPGESGIPVEYYLLAVESKEDRSKAMPTESNLFGQLLLLAVRGMLEHSVVPPCLRRAVLVSVPKRDCDLTLLDSYRGISLMESLLKIVCTLLNRRLSAAIEARDLLAKDQAGFRKKEEGIAQVVALNEICGRRAAVGKPTYLAFLDLKKAYDRVPHGALMQTLRRFGVHGNAFAFIQRLYAVSSSRVRLPCGMSDEIKLQRGLRQGCPLSCLLYDMFADDSRYSLQGLGVDVPGVTERATKLDFADDQVLLAGSAAELQEALKRMSAWGDLHEMEFGVKKCGVMVMHGPQSHLDNINLQLQGQELPRVTCYRYLGIMVDTTFDVKTMLGAREERIKNATAACVPFLRCKRIPISIRLTIVRACLLPIATFGGELWGFNKAHAARLQRAFDFGLKLVVLGSGKSRACSMRAIYRETGIAPIDALNAAARLRLLLKSATMRTWIRVLCDHPAGRMRPQWFANGRAQVKKMEKPGIATLSDRVRVREMKEARWAKGDVAALSTVSWPWYRGFEESRAYIWTKAYGARLIVGISLLMAMRMGGFQTTTKLVQAGRVKPEFRFKCPCCMEDVAESVEHILLFCKCWEKPRKKMFKRLNEAIARNKLKTIAWEDLLQQGKIDFVVRLLLGGAASLVSQPQVKLSPVWELGGCAIIDGDKVIESKRAIDWSKSPMAWAVAWFLGKIARHRSEKVLKHRIATTKSESHFGTTALPPAMAWGASLFGPDG